MFINSVSDYNGESLITHEVRLFECQFFFTQNSHTDSLPALGYGTTQADGETDGAHADPYNARYVRFELREDAFRSGDTKRESLVPLTRRNDTWSGTKEGACSAASHSWGSLGG